MVIKNPKAYNCRRHPRVLTACLAFFLLLTAFGTAAGQTGPSSPGVNESTVRIGTWGPQTGQASPWGATVRGMETYFKWLNATGGVNGRMLELVSFDDPYDSPERTLTNLRAMADNESQPVFALAGGVGAASGRAVIDYVEQQGIPWVGPASPWSGYADPPRKHVFAVMPPSRDEAAALVKYAVEVMGRKKIAIFYQDDEYGRDGLTGAKTYLAEYGLEPAVAIGIRPDYKALKTRLLALKQAEPEAVLLWITPAHAALLLAAAEEYRFKPVWMAGAPLADAKLMDNITAGRWEGAIFTSCGVLPGSEDPLLKQYHKAFIEHAPRGEQWSVLFYAGFGLAEPLIEGLRRTGPDLTRERFIQSMETLDNFKGIFGRISYGPARRQGQKEMFICQAVKRGGARPLTGWFRLEDLPPAPGRDKPAGSGVEKKQ